VQFAQGIGMSHAADVGCLLAIWGEALAELGDLDEALERAQRGVELAERGTDVIIIGWSYVCLVRVLVFRGDLPAAQEICRRAEEVDREYGIPPWITNLMSAWQARIWLAQGKLEAASQWARERELDAGHVSPYPRELENMVLARILIAQGRLTEAAPLLQRLLEATEAGGRISRAIEVLLLQALALQAGGDTDQALAALERALTLAAPRGLIQVFVNEGPPMAALLYQAATRGIMPDYTGQLLAAFPAVDASPVAPPKVSTSQIRVQPAVGTVILEPLSEREIEVLELVAEGLTNQEIASRLFLSLHTIKAHTRNIYGKLDVHSRTEAVARARALGVLSPT
jgi:LuxR family maltose regulon positive regulatory protein